MGKIIEAILAFFKSLFAKKEKEQEPVTSGATEPEIEVNTGSTEPVQIGDESDSHSVSPVVEPAENNNTATTEAGGTEIYAGKVSNMKILVDNGHGVDTPGKRSPWSANKTLPEIEFYEYKWNREIAAPIVERLKALGYDAELIVTEEKDISLGERARRVNKICDSVGKSNVILISIHANAGGMGKDWVNAKGWCAFTTVGQTKSDKLADYLYAEAEKNFAGRQIRKDTSDGDKDWESNFYILKNTNCPCVLTENFFYDNVDDVKYILSDEGREAVIKTHVDGIINYIKSL